MLTRISSCLALAVLVAALAAGNPWLPCRSADAADAAANAVAAAPPSLAKPSRADEVCPDPALAVQVVACGRDANGEPIWHTRDGRTWRRNPMPAGGAAMVVVSEGAVVDAATEAAAGSNSEPNSGPESKSTPSVQGR